MKNTLLKSSRAAAAVRLLFAGRAGKSPNSPGTSSGSRRESRRPPFAAKTAWVIFLILVSAGHSARADDATPLWAQEQKDLRITPPTRPIPAAFFCTHAPMLGKQQGAVSPPITPADVKGWPGNGYRVFGGMPPCDWTPERTRVLGAGSLSWGGVEYVKGEWRWEMTDPGIGILAHNLPPDNAGLLVNLKSIPPWAAKDPTADGSMPWAPQIYRGSSSVPADMKDWENYLTRLVTRYKGQIKYYETPNEANHEMKLTPQQILENNRVMYRTIKRIDPWAVVVGPATAGTPTMAEWTGEYMALGGKDITDIVSCHFYGQPEAIPYMYGKVKAELRRAGAGDKPIWNSESGYLADSQEAAGPDKNLESRRAKTARAFLLQWALGIQRWYVFGDVNSPGMKQAIEQTQKWMTGAVMTRCEVKNLVWECEFRRNGRRCLIAWAGPKYPHQLDEKLEYPDHAVLIVPNGFGHWETLSGDRKTITGNALPLSPTPVMISP